MTCSGQGSVTPSFVLLGFKWGSRALPVEPRLSLYYTPWVHISFRDQIVPGAIVILDQFARGAADHIDKLEHLIGC